MINKLHNLEKVMDSTFATGHSTWLRYVLRNSVSTLGDLKIAAKQVCSSNTAKDESTELQCSIAVSYCSTLQSISIILQVAVELETLHQNDAFLRSTYEYLKRNGIYDHEFERMPLLEKILKQCPELHIVVSSSWRETMTLEGLKYLFPVAFRHRIIGVTPSLQEVKDTEYVRYRECLIHARHMGINKFIIIDDESHRFPPGCENLVSTNYSEGMTDQTVESVIMKYCQYLT